MAIAEDPAAPNRFIFACTANGVAAKCARGWGFRPWRTSEASSTTTRPSDWVERTFALKPFYDACKLAARAAYCQDRQSFTREGTLVDLFDTRQLVWPNAIENPFGDDPAVALDVRAGAVRLRRSAGGPPDAQGVGAAAHALPRAVAGRAVRRAGVRRSAGAGPLRGRTLGQPAHEHAAHPGAVTQLLRAQRARSGRGAGVGLQPVHHVGLQAASRAAAASTRRSAPWDALCVAQADATCDDPPGRVWPRDLPAAAAATREVPARPRRRGRARRPRRRRRCDAGGMGVRPRVAGRRGDGGDSRRRAARAAGQHAAGRRPRRRGAGLAAVARGQRRLRWRAPARPPDTDFPSRRRPDSAGPFFVYALDAATADGPAAPPTLLRNGIVDLADPRRGRHAAGHGHHRVDRGAASGSYTFWSGLEPSRLFVNGRKLVDWWAGSGPTEGSIDLVAGGKYHVRWDRFEPAPPPPDSARRPHLARAGKRGADHRSRRRCSIAWRPGAARGWRRPTSTMPVSRDRRSQRLDAVVDLGTAWPATTRLPDGIAASDFSAIWQGEIVPDYSDSLPVRRDHRRAGRPVDRRPGAAAARADRAAAGARPAGTTSARWATS